MQFLMQFSPALKRRTVVLPQMLSANARLRDRFRYIELNPHFFCLIRSYCGCRRPPSRLSSAIIRYAVPQGEFFHPTMRYAAGQHSCWEDLDGYIAAEV